MLVLQLPTQYIKTFATTCFDKPDLTVGDCIEQEQAAALYALGMLDYGEMKARLMLTTLALVATGSTICWIHGDMGEALGPAITGDKMLIDTNQSARTSAEPLLPRT